MRQEDNFPRGSFFAQNDNQSGDGGKQERREREKRPSGGKGWAQQPEADWRG